MVPNGWTKTTFGEHIDLLNGFAFKSALYSNDENDIKLLRGDNIEPNKLRWRNVKRWSKDDYESLEKYHLKVSDFIIAMDRTWITAGLKVAEVKQEDLPCLLVQRVSRIRSLPTLCQDLIKHHFSSFRFEQYVKSVQTETAVPHISSTQINEFNLLLPPLPEQQKIAKTLSTWDKAISATERLIDNSTQQKKALMQQLLTGKKRLLDESGKRFEGEWKFSNFEDLFKVANNKKTQIKSSDYLNEGALPIVDQGKRLVSGYTNNNEVYSDIPVIVFGDHTRIIKWIDFEFAQGADGTQVLKNAESLHAKFAYYILLNADIPNLGYSRHMRELKERDFKYPLDKTEQQKIATVLTTADKEIELLEQQLTDLQQEKKALMQVLLTGKKRVRVDGEVKT
ncbi:restriction endonuclease subunit S [Psychrobacter sp. AOP3-A1-26]|uniref:restriction endonuclease subunit S n=1 Tax=Psychrobacter sp. AOP3-A1-26 TaxID=3457700 RepID=UPI00403551A0